MSTSVINFPRVLWKFPAIYWRTPVTILPYKYIFFIHHQPNHIIQDDIATHCGLYYCFGPYYYYCTTTTALLLLLHYCPAYESLQVEALYSITWPAAIWRMHTYNFCCSMSIVTYSCSVCSFTRGLLPHCIIKFTVYTLLLQQRHQQQQDIYTGILLGILILYDHIDITRNRLYKIDIKFCTMCGI